jgi:hypothetical protein
MVLALIFPAEIMLEFPAKAAILGLRQSSGVRSFQDSRASEFGGHSKAAAFARQSRHDFSEPMRFIRVS